MSSRQQRAARAAASVPCWRSGLRISPKEEVVAARPYDHVIRRRTRSTLEKPDHRSIGSPEERFASYYLLEEEELAGSHRYHRGQDRGVVEKRENLVSENCLAYRIVGYIDIGDGKARADRKGEIGKVA